MSVTLKIRPFEAADRPALQELRHAAFRPVFQSFRDIVGDPIYAIALAKSDLEQAELLDSLCNPGSAHQLFVGLWDEDIIGFVSFSLDRETRVGEIGLNAVHPDHAGKGVGTCMYDFVVSRMKEAGMQVATVGTGGDPSHAPARRAYEKAGFNVGLPSLWLYKKIIVPPVLPASKAFQEACGPMAAGKAGRVRQAVLQLTTDRAQPNFP